jgi:hypothetical protein
MPMSLAHKFAAIEVNGGGLIFKNLFLSILVWPVGSSA